ncbi:MAG: tetratricopeptide repeat protein [Candidatus Heimdallarchaeota archaeon]|nr:tetratricopeptide repeat protein [Candidatus Heimdallarchaeota archaeon]MCK5048634.1 tetratricopeptide repeat protein [Candidatus Heimdallarchaeota archaeon]
MVNRILDKLRTLLKKEESIAELTEIDEILEKIDHKLVIGKYEQALTELSDINKEKMTKQQLLTCDVLKGQCLIKVGDLKQALITTESVLNDSKKKKYQVIALDAMLTKSEALWRLGQLDESFDILQIVNQKIQKNKDQDEVKSQKSSMLYHLGVIYYFKGKFDQALESYLSSLSLAEELALDQDVGQILNNIGAIYHLQGDLGKALDYYQQSLSIKEKFGNKQELAKSVNNVGVIYYLKGELDLALENYQKSLSLKEELGQKQSIALTLNNIGTVYQFTEKLELALEQYQECLALFEEIGNKMLMAEPTFNLLTVYIDLKDITKARETYASLKEINEYEENKRINLQLRIAEAFILKSSTRSKNRVKAEEILEEIINEPVFDNELTVMAMISLSELLLYELKTSSSEEELLNELKELTQKLLEMGRKQHSYTLIAETYWVQAQLAIVELDIKKAKALLSQAQVIAEERGLEKLARQVSNEHDGLLDQIDNLESLSKRNASINERLEAADLDKIVSKMSKKKDVKLPEQSEEEPVLLLLTSTSGIPAFSKQFLPESELDDILISGFISAINTALTSFMMEAFDNEVTDIKEKHLPVERIKYKDYTLVMEFNDPLLFCYVFKGESYSAMQKLDKFITNALESSLIWESLQKASTTGDTSFVKGNESIEEWIKEIF